MARGIDDEVAVAEAYANARSLRADDATAVELARQCYRDLFPGVAEDRVAAEVERIVKPVRAAVDAGRSWWAGG